MSQMSFSGELDEADLRHELWFEPLHFVHLVGCDPGAPMRRLAVRQIHKPTLGRVQWFQRFEHLSPYVRCKACPDFARVPELLVLVSTRR